MQIYSVMNNDCLFSYEEDVFWFLSKFCVWGSTFQANVIRSAQNSLSFLFLSLSLSPLSCRELYIQALPSYLLKVRGQWNNKARKLKGEKKQQKIKAKKP